MTDIKILIGDVLKQEELTPNDIPDLELYMDQILTLIESKLASTKRNKEDKLLTKTMINNYSKAKVIQPIKGKKYSKQQIIQLLIVNNLKNSLSISEIHDLMKPIYNNNIDVIGIFQKYLDCKMELNENLFNSLDKAISDNLTNEEDELLLFLKLSYLSNAINKIIFKIYDDNYKSNK